MSLFFSASRLNPAAELLLHRRWSPAEGMGAHCRGEGSAEGGVHQSDASAIPRRKRQRFQLQVSHS